MLASTLSAIAVGPENRNAAAGRVSTQWFTASRAHQHLIRIVAAVTLAGAGRRSRDCRVNNPYSTSRVDYHESRRREMNQTAGFSVDTGTVVLLVVLLVAVIAAPYVSGLFLKTVSQSQRLIVERMGRYVGFRGPGRYLVVPFVDRGILVDLDESLPGWRGMSAQQIEEKLIAMWYGEK
jgi:hypothetical protein